MPTGRCFVRVMHITILLSDILFFLKKSSINKAKIYDFMISYEYLRKLSFPLPSYRTLCERVKKLHLEPGIQYKILDYMESIACATDQHT